MKNYILESLYKCPLFSDISDDNLNKIINDYTTESIINKNEIIFSENSYFRGLVIITKGSASVKKNNGDTKILMSILKQGDIFGMATLFYESENYLTEITADEKVSILTISKENVLKLFSEYPEISKNYITILSEKIHFLNKKINTYTRSETISKVSLFILQHLNKELKVSVLPYSITKVADALNIGRASVYRAFETLEAEGVISRNGKIINIPDCTELEKYR